MFTPYQERKTSRKSCLKLLDKWKMFFKPKRREASARYGRPRADDGRPTAKGWLKMTLQEIIRFEFVRIDEYNRYIINARKAHNSFTLDAVLSVLQSNGYKLAQYFPGVIIGIKSA